MKKNSQIPGKTNWPVTILLILGLYHDLFSIIYGSDHCIQKAVRDDK